MITPNWITNLLSPAGEQIDGLAGYGVDGSDYWEAIQVDQTKYVLDTDIQKALNQARANVNPEIFEDDTILIDAFKYCMAHFLVLDIRMAESGLDSIGEGIITNKSMGGVSVGIGIPEAYTKSPMWNIFGQTQYGQKYMTYVIPRITGRIGVAAGATLP